MSVKIPWFFGVSRGRRLAYAAARVEAGLAVPGQDDVFRLTMHDARAGRWLKETRDEMLRLGAEDSRP